MSMTQVARFTTPTACLQLLAEILGSEPMPFSLLSITSFFGGEIFPCRFFFLQARLEAYIWNANTLEVLWTNAWPQTPFGRNDFKSEKRVSCPGRSLFLMKGASLVVKRARLEWPKFAFGSERGPQHPVYLPHLFIALTLFLFSFLSLLILTIERVTSFLKNEEFPALASFTHSKKSHHMGKLRLPTNSFPLRPHLVLGLFLVEWSPRSKFWLCEIGRASCRERV